MKLHTLRLLTVIKTHLTDRRQRSNQGYRDYLEFWRTHYIR